MPDVTVTRTTNLRGRDLQTAVQSMVTELAGQSPYSAVNMTQRWEGGSRIILEAGGHMNGAVDIQDGSPSRVTAQINLLSGMARMYRDRVIRDINAIADRRLGGTPTATAAPPAQPTTATPTATAPPTTPRRQVDPEEAGAITGGVFDSLNALARGFLENLDTEREPSVLDRYQLPELPPDPGTATATATPAATVTPDEILIYGPPAPEPSAAVAPAAPASTYDYEWEKTSGGAYYEPPTQQQQQQAFPWGWALAGAGALVGTIALVAVVSRGRGD